MRGDGLRRGRALSPEKPHIRSGSLADIRERIRERIRGCPLYPQKQTCSSSTIT